MAETNSNLFSHLTRSVGRDCSPVYQWCCQSLPRSTPPALAAGSHSLLVLLPILPGMRLSQPGLQLQVGTVNLRVNPELDNHTAPHMQMGPCSVQCSDAAILEYLFKQAFAFSFCSGSCKWPGWSWSDPYFPKCEPGPTCTNINWRNFRNASPLIPPNLLNQNLWSRALRWLRCTGKFETHCMSELLCWSGWA